MEADLAVCIRDNIVDSATGLDLVELVHGKDERVEHVQFGNEIEESHATLYAPTSTAQKISGDLAIAAQQAAQHVAQQAAQSVGYTPAQPAPQPAPQLGTDGQWWWPTPSEIAAGDANAMKGTGKGTAKGKGKGYFQGECSNCGKAGHSQRNCYAP